MLRISTRLPGATLALLIIVTPAPTYGAHIDEVANTTLALLTCKLLPGENGTTLTWHCRVDPLNVDAFQLDFQFDASGFEFVGLNFIDPYVQTAPPDLSLIGSGLIQDIAGESSISPPPPGDVDIYEVVLRNRPGSSGPPVFTAFASGNDFIRSFDTDTGQSFTIGPDRIVAATCVPEPSSATLQVIGLVAYGVITRVAGRLRSRSQTSSETA